MRRGKDYSDLSESETDSRNICTRWITLAYLMHLERIKVHGIEKIKFAFTCEWFSKETHTLEVLPTTSDRRLSTPIVSVGRVRSFYRKKVSTSLRFSFS